LNSQCTCFAKCRCELAKAKGKRETAKHGTNAFGEIFGRRDLRASL
jgi:hypothetical protein